MEKILEENTQATQKRDLIHWSFLGLGPFGSIETLAFFYGSTPNSQRALQALQDEMDLWQLAGAKGLTALGLRRVVQ